MRYFKNLDILDKKDKVKFIFIVFLTLVGTFFEIIGLGLIVPLTIIITDPLVIENNQYINKFVIFFEIKNRQNLLIISIFFVFLIYLLKLIYLTFLSWKKYSYSYGLQKKISIKIFKIFLDQPYLYFTSLNSSRLIQDTKDEPALFSSYVVGGLLDILAEVLIILGIVILLLSYNFLTSLILLLIVLLIIFFYKKIFKTRTIFWSKERKHFDQLSYNILKYVYGSIIEVKISNKENIIKDKFSYLIKNSIDNQKKQFFMTDLPRLYLEFIAVFFFLSFVFYAIFIDNNLENLIPTSALYAASAFKILPSLNRIIVGIQRVNFGKNSREVIKKIINLKKKDPGQKNYNLQSMDFKKHIKINNLNFSFKDRPNVIRNLNLTINYGDIIGIKGESGEGKTTFVNLILGLIKSDNKNREITVDDKVVLDFRSWQKNVSYAPQKVFILDDTLKNNICFEEDENNINKELLDKCIKLASLEKLVESLPNKLDTMIGENGSKLSGGQIQRIGFARAVYKNPKFIIFDEITSSLDQTNEKIILNSIKKLSKKMTILLVSHKQEPLEICNKVYELKDGKLEII